MKEKEFHNNPWADKLQNLPVPEVGKTWQDMQLVLDREMPVSRQDRRWLYWLLSLLLLIGVCTVPSLWKDDVPLNQKQTKQRERTMVKPGVQYPAPAKQVTAADKKQQELKNALPVPATTGGTNVYQHLLDVSKSRRGKGSDPSVTESVKNNNDVYRNAMKASKHLTTSKKTRVPLPRRKEKTDLKNELVPEVAVATHGGENTAVDGFDNIPSTDTAKQISPKTVSDSIQRVTQPAKQNSQKDSSQLQKRAQLRKHDRGFAAAIGFNQFFPVGGQDRSAFTSSGESGSWGDYLPVPQLRYHFNRHVYVMAEAQFNAPQYTEQVALSQTRTDTNGLGQRMQRSVFVKKLFYFNLPLSVHVTPVKNVNLGAGMQFSRLKNAVGLFEETQQAPNRPDSIKRSQIASIKGDASYRLLRTNEWRLLADASYSYKRFLFGARYNHALASFVQVPVSNQQLKQARNHSLQLYIRYTFWDQRK